MPLGRIITRLVHRIKLVPHVDCLYAFTYHPRSDEIVLRLCVYHYIEPQFWTTQRVRFRGQAGQGSRGGPLVTPHFHLTYFFLFPSFPLWVFYSTHVMSTDIHDMHLRSF